MSKAVEVSEAKSGGTATGKNKATVAEIVISREPVTLTRVRENINNMVGNAAEQIVIQLIHCAGRGEVAPAKYLFELVGLYGATQETEEKPKENSLAYMLLKHLGLPTEPVTEDEDFVAEDCARSAM